MLLPKKNNRTMSVDNFIFLFYVARKTRKWFPAMRTYTKKKNKKTTRISFTKLNFKWYRCEHNSASIRHGHPIKHTSNKTVSNYKFSIQLHSFASWTHAQNYAMPHWNVTKAFWIRWIFQFVEILFSLGMNGNRTEYLILDHLHRKAGSRSRQKLYHSALVFYLKNFF